MDYNKNCVENPGPATTGAVNGNATLQSKDEDLRKLKYGWGKCRPGFLQFMNKPKWFLVIAVGYALCQGISVLGLQNLVLPTIERRYHFSSKELGLIAAANDVSALLLVAFISYYGDYANKAKWIGYGAVLTGIGIILFALPQAIVEKYEPVGTRSSMLCKLATSNANSTMSQCNKASGGQWYYMLTFVVAQLIIGIGNSPYYALIFPYLDEIVEPRSISTYLGVLNCMNFLGPGLGYLIGGQFLSIYVDIKQPAGVKLNPRSSAWIGAWWLGFLVFGAGVLVFAVFLLGFPAEMPGAKERREQHMRKGHLKRPQSKQNAGLKEFLPELRKLLTNWTYLFSTLSLTVSMYYVGALSIFLSKLMRDKFGLNPVVTGYSLAAVATLGVFLGNLVGSFIVRQFSLKGICKSSALMCTIVYFILLPSPSIFLVRGCDTVNLVGVTSAHTGRNFYRNVASPRTVSTMHQVKSRNNQSSSLHLLSQCNTHCGCSLKRFLPVCGSNSVTYINPCFAGCKKMLRNKTFTNCSCIPGPSGGNSSREAHGTATLGYCNRNCKNAIIFLVLCAIILTVRATLMVPMKIVNLRCVPEDKRAFANGINYFALKAFALLPTPIVFGHLLDMSCRLWQNICGSKGRCFDYNIDTLSKNVCIYGSTILALSAILFFLAWYFCKTEDDMRCKTTVKARENYGMDDVKDESSTKL